MLHVSAIEDRPEDDMDLVSGLAWHFLILLAGHAPFQAPFQCPFPAVSAPILQQLSAPMCSMIRSMQGNFNCEDCQEAGLLNFPIVFTVQNCAQHFYQ